VLLAALGAVLVGAGALLGSTTGALIGLVLGLVMVAGSYWFSDRLAIRAAGARPITEAEAPRVHRIVRRLSERAGMPMPRLYLSPADQPNAFATGRNPEHAAVCVTAGILPLLDDEELEGVLAHELSHVANRDILIGSVAAALAMGITALARFAMWGTMFGGGRRRGGGPLALVGIVAMAVLAPLAAMLIQLAISRSREFEADHSGAELVGTGVPLARALAQLDAAAARTPMAVDAAHATAYIVNPLTGRQVDFAGMFRTHPSTADRIARLTADTSSGAGAGPVAGRPV
jgi:heat shock protein HtpX